VALLPRLRGGLAEVGTGLWVAAGVLIAAIVGVWATGGFAPAHRAAVELAELAPGDVHTNGQFSVAFAHAELTDDPDLYLDEGEVALRIELRLENRWDEPFTASAIVEDAIAISGLPEDAAIDIGRSDGTRGGVILQPGIPVDLTVAWDLPEGTFTPGSELDITVSDGTLRQFAVLDDVWAWGRYTPAAHAALMIEDRMGMTK
jgi:hypothetical protein